MLTQKPFFILLKIHQLYDLCLVFETSDSIILEKQDFINLGLLILDTGVVGFCEKTQKLLRDFLSKVKTLMQYFE